MSETDRFCPKCGRGASDKTVSETDERELYSFGPLGVGIFHVRPSIFTWSNLNMTRIVRARGAEYPSLLHDYRRKLIPQLDHPLPLQTIERTPLQARRLLDWLR